MVLKLFNLLRRLKLTGEVDDDKPESFKLSSGNIGYNLGLTRTYYPFLIKHNGGYTVDTTPVVTFTIRTHQPPPLLHRSTCLTLARSCTTDESEPFAKMSPVLLDPRHSHYVSQTVLTTGGQTKTLNRRFMHLLVDMANILPNNLASLMRQELVDSDESSPSKIPKRFENARKGEFIFCDPDTDLSEFVSV